MFKIILKLTSFYKEFVGKTKSDFGFIKQTFRLYIFKKAKYLNSSIKLGWSLGILAFRMLAWLVPTSSTIVKASSG